MYWLITIIRNFLFNCGIIKSRRFDDVFVMCIGNIRVGGTGKTPMTEYLIRNLNTTFPLAVVSLGYKRKTKGLKEVLLSDSAEAVGDEPKQMKEKFPTVPFFVNKNRNIAIDYIRKNLPHIRLILLDDAYQYRKTTPNFTILLTEFSRPYFHDRIIPYGRLRERKGESKRADYIVVTKCPDNLSEENKTLFTEKLNIKGNQEVFFSKIKYDISNINFTTSKILFVAGIDNPLPATEFLKSQGYDVLLQKYPDHHAFSESDIKQIKTLAANDRLVITTEKDAVRLKDKGLSFEVLKITNEIDNNFLEKLKYELRRNIRG